MVSIQGMLNNVVHLEIMFLVVLDDSQTTSRELNQGPGKDPFSDRSLSRISSFFAAVSLTEHRI